MFCKPNGQPAYPGPVVREFVWDALNDTALPSWLVKNGTDSTIAFETPAVGRGVAKVTTKSATPASGDQAGVSTAFTINSANFEEISFIVYSGLSDSATNTIQNLGIGYNNGSTGGMFWQNNDGVGGVDAIRLYPAAGVNLSTGINLATSLAKRKNFGVTIRPRTKEIWFTHGDPYDCGGGGYYSKGSWTDTNSVIDFYVRAKTAAQRTVEFSKIKLRLVSY